MLSVTDSAPPLALRENERAPLLPESETARLATPSALARTSRRMFLLALAGVLLAGALLRFYPSTGCKTLGFDEGMYRSYLGMLVRFGPSTYPAMVEAYPIAQQNAPEAMLPPTRALFLLAAWSWHAVFGGENLLSALRGVSALFSTLTVLLAARLGLRLGGRAGALAAAALFACAPLQIHLAQRALIDGFFTFWAMLAFLALWEIWQSPPATRARSGWCALYALALAALVLTKQENAAFLLASLLALLALNRWARFGHTDRLLVTLTFVAPAFGFVVLVFLCGGVDRLWTAYQMNVQKSLVLPYAIETGDGPWHRYLLDLLTANPAVLLLAIGGGFLALRPVGSTAAAPDALPMLRLDRRGALYLVGFVAVSYALMCRLRYGMNLRYAAIWDLPLTLLALSQLGALVEAFKARRILIFSIGVTALCALELAQYHRLFMAGAIYDPIPAQLLRALDILKG